MQLFFAHPTPFTGKCLSLLDLPATDRTRYGGNEAFDTVQHPAFMLRGNKFCAGGVRL
jgi:hypothetical protein